ncbi:MAG TPA: acyl-CoA dehydrogenase C-terminal domain-containing protein, partial [Ottowia sp.]|nr:acyl-CoA dehydrogenase C-terminal domain-containing protein [Ottowia sp.]
NAVPYMQAFGHVVIAWIWLELSLASSTTKTIAAGAGVAGARTYFYRYELPKIDAWLRVVESRDLTCAQLPEEAF